MIIGILKEIKPQEYRVCMTPSGVFELVQHQHTVLVENNAGIGAGFSNEDYKNVGATIVDTPQEIYAKSDMVMHVKELQPSEYDMIKEGQIVFTYLHLAAEEKLTHALIKAKSVNIAYETVEKEDKTLPLLAPMSEVAGRLATQEGAKYLEKHYGGLGVLLGGVTGVERANVVVIGAGVVGYNSAIIAAGMGAQVYLFDRSPERMRILERYLPANITVLMSQAHSLKEHLKTADLVVGAVLVAGAKAPKLVTKEDLKTMKKGAVLVDVAIDQGGCFETSKATTHDDPIYVVDGIVHYCVANMPGAVARTSTLALTNATTPYALDIANKGWKKACQDDPALAKGLNVVQGKVVYKAVSDAFGIEYTDPQSFLK